MPRSLSVADARKLAINFLVRLYIEKKDPAEIQVTEYKKNEITLCELIERYEPWLLNHRKSGQTTLRILNLFNDFLSKQISEIDTPLVTAWQLKKKETLKGATINRRIAALRSLINWGAKQGICDAPAFEVKKMPHSDSKIITRYLSDSERERLLRALEQWELSCGKSYLKPAVILSLNTGIRKGTLLSLEWRDIDFELQTLVLRAEIMKGGKQCTIPLNDNAVTCLKKWREHSMVQTGYIFSDKGKKIRDTKRSFNKVLKKADIKDFTWHCLRHDFASQLAMKGVPLHTIQKLLCHSSIEMTQRYAHLAPNILKDAVVMLV